MAHESFEDEDVARLLNEHFVAIKVDREERPDIDQIYMTVCQAMTGQGGWPLTVLMTANQQPFFAGTYFPKDDRWGRPGLVRILSGVAQQWREKPGEMQKSAADIVGRLKPYLERSEAGDVDAQMVDDGASLLLEKFDSEYGGFGEAPKFPTPHQLLFLMRCGWQHQRSDVQNVVNQTLKAMENGGIYDHIGFGFARYSTDRKWLVPHFEKMLYDNALLAIAFTEAWQLTGDMSFAATARQIFTYILRDMRDDEGGFYCAEDADSEGVEGKFYVWTPQEVCDVLGDEVGSRVCRWFHITVEGNFEGASVPNRIDAPTAAEFAEAEGLSEADWIRELETCRRRLFEHREQRIHPHKDDKILTAWNGLMIAALAVAGRVFGEDAYVDAARDAARFVRTRLVDDDGRLLTRYREGEAAHAASVDDYAFFIWGLLELYASTFEPDFLRHAIQLQSDMTARFSDAAQGGFFFSAADSESLIARPKEIYDGAMPSGNSVAAMNLLRMARLTGRTKFEEEANRLLRAFAGDVRHYPAGHTFYLMSLMFGLGRGQELVMVGSSDDVNTQSAIRRIQQSFLPQTVVLFRDASKWAETGDELAALAPFVAEQRALDGKLTFYVCENFACRQPTHDIEAVLGDLRIRV